MSVTLSQETEVSQRLAPHADGAPAAGPGMGRAGLIGLGVTLAAFCAGGLALWARYGAAVFFDLLSAGFAACL
ncbi:hypothetical protein [Xanthobacter sp.]|uniref:hypothetical protein n=1 Tax=Xanthobacter sp. TaxID=35809 RepID=UPI0025E685C3|nr:hypothetical protein [Xanthobacter sp.]